MGDLYYSFNYKNAHFTILDTDNENGLPALRPFSRFHPFIMPGQADRKLSVVRAKGPLA